MGVPIPMARPPLDDDVHLLRQAMLRRGVADAWRMLAMPLSGLLTGSMVTQVGRQGAGGCWGAATGAAGCLIGLLQHLRTALNH